MRKYAIHFDDLELALSKSNKNAAGGYIEQTADQFVVQANGLFDGIQDIRNVPVKRLANLKVVTIGDLAKVQIGQPLRTGAVLNNGEETVLGTVLMLLGENSREVSLRVPSKLSKSRKACLKAIIFKHSTIDQSLLTLR